MTVVAPGALNAVCPYFTMFPVSFPLDVLRRQANAGEWVLDPFSGRGTTNYAARQLGLPSIGVDSNPVAAALTAAKLANTTSDAVIRAAEQILRKREEVEIPRGEFWRRCYRKSVLEDVCRLRETLLASCTSEARKGLRGVLLGALHGPMRKHGSSYLSNQCPRTYAPKPRYAVRYWSERGLVAPRVDVLGLISERARRFFSNERPATGIAIRGDSRTAGPFSRLESDAVSWVITSPPYYGLRTYIPDQWIRYWFVGGPSEVAYSVRGQLDHGSPEAFADDLALVWENTSRVCRNGARLVIRFGGISDRDADPLTILRRSINKSPWRLQTVVSAGTATRGKRQADHFLQIRSRPQQEFDAWASLV